MPLVAVGGADSRTTRAAGVGGSGASQPLAPGSRLRPHHTTTRHPHHHSAVRRPPRDRTVVGQACVTPSVGSRGSSTPLELSELSQLSELSDTVGALSDTVGALSDCRTVALSEHCRAAVGPLSETVGQVWNRQGQLPLAVGHCRTVGLLSDCRAVGLSDYCRTLSEGCRRAVGVTVGGSVPITPLPFGPTISDPHLEMVETLLPVVVVVVVVKIQLFAGIRNCDLKKFAYHFASDGLRETVRSQPAPET
jgi:hypothetical protein